MKRLNAALFFALVTLVFIVSCKRDDPSWDLDLTAPVAYGSLSLDNLIADSLTSSGADGSVRITYHTKIEGLNADSLFNIPDTTVINSYNLPVQANLSSGTYLVNNVPTQTTYALAPAQLVYGILERGDMIVHMQNDLQKRVIVTYEISSATLNGNPAIITYVMPAAPSATVASVADLVVNLDNYEINFTGLQGDRVNTLVTRFTAQIDPTDVGTVAVVPADSVVAKITFSDVRPSYIRGYFGSEISQIGPEESYVGFFSRVQSGQLGLDSIYMTFTIENYAGLDARLTVNNLWSRRSLSNQTVMLNHSLIGSPVNINRAMYSFAYPPSIPQIYSWQFNNSNSNIVDMVEIMPDYFGYDFSLYTNPLGNVSGNNDFLYPRFGINAYLDLDIPVNFYADQLVLADTIETTFGIENVENVQTANLTLYADNGFPFDAGVQVYLLDGNAAIIDSIIAQPALIYSAPLTSSAGYFFSSGFTPTVLQIPMNEVQTQRFLNSSRVVVKARFNTNTNPMYVKIFSTNRLDFNLTADFEYRVN